MCFAFLSSFSSLHCGQSIAMNSCECGTTNTHSPLLRDRFIPVRVRHHRSSMLNLYTYMCVYVIRSAESRLYRYPITLYVLLGTHPDRMWIFPTNNGVFKLSRYVVSSNRIIHRALVHVLGFGVFVRPNLENFLHNIMSMTLCVCIKYMLYHILYLYYMHSCL